VFRARKGPDGRAGAELHHLASMEWWADQVVPTSKNKAPAEVLPRPGKERMGWKCLGGTLDSP